jgi:histone-lysine N-methyltransferase SETMAR
VGTLLHFKTQLSAGKDYGKLFWHSDGMVHICFIPQDVTINVQYYSNWLHSDVHKAVQKIKPGKLTKKIILLHDKMCPHMADLTMTLATVSSKIMNHPPFSSDLALSDFHLFGPLKAHLGGQKFQSMMNSNLVY